MMDVKRGKKDLHAALDDMQNLEAGLRLKIKNYLNRNKLYIDDILPSDLDTLVEKAKRRIGEE